MLNFSPLRSSDPNTRDWQTINRQGRQAQYLRDLHAGTRDIVTRLDRDPFDSPYMFPFRLYSFPSVWRAAPNPGADWLKFRVHAGRYLGTIVQGTDGADKNPGAPGYPRTPDDDAIPTETETPDILIPAGTNQFWFWIDATNPAAPIIKSAANPALQGWTAFPTTDAAHIPIGYVDASTDAANGNALIRQLLRADISNSGSGSSGGYQGIYDPAKSYTAGMMVRVATGSTAGFWVVVPGATAAAGQAPAYPEPVGAIWHMIAFGQQILSICSGSGTEIPINAGSPF